MYFFNFFLVFIFLNRNIGESGEIRSERAIGGTEANPEEWKYIAGVVYGRYVACLGTLIRENWVLTIATAIDGERKNNYTMWFGEIKIRLGASDLTYVESKAIEIKSGFPKEENPILAIGVNDRVIGIEKIIKHDQFRVLDVDDLNQGPAKVASNNAALIKLSTPHPDANPIPFAKKTFMKTCKPGKYECSAAGWGSPAKAGTTVKFHVIGKLKDVCCHLKQEDQTKCSCSVEINSRLLNYWTTLRLLTGFLTYGDDKLLVLTEKNKYVHENDAGGPLICEDPQTGVKILQGIIISNYSFTNYSNKPKTEHQLNIFGDVGYFDNIDIHLGERTTVLTTGTTSKSGGKPTQSGNTLSTPLYDASRSSISRKNNFKLTIFVILIEILLNY